MKNTLKNLIVITAIIATLLLTGCTSEQDCDEELEKLEVLRSNGWNNCNGSSACVAKIESDYANAKEKVLKNCN